MESLCSRSLSSRSLLLNNHYESSFGRFETINCKAIHCTDVECVIFYKIGSIYKMLNKCLEEYYASYVVVFHSLVFRLWYVQRDNKNCANGRRRFPSSVEEETDIQTM